jgi:plastocyanin
MNAPALWCAFRPTILVRWLVVAVVLSFATEGFSPSALAGQSNSHATGRIEGNTILAPSLSARKVRFRLYSSYGPGELPPRTPASSNELSNVVIHLELVAPGATAAGHRAATMEQLDERFAPHVLPVVVGSSVEFPNRDPVYHNVFSLSGTRTFDLGRYPKGASKSVRFDRPGVVQVFCHIHSDMSAVILVLPNAFHTTPDSSGRYVLDGVPPGEYRITAWHERIKPITRTIQVTAGASTNQDFSIPVMNER